MGKGQARPVRQGFGPGLLQNPYYTGVVPYFGANEKGQKRKHWDTVALYPGQHEPLVDQETFDACLSIRQALGNHPRNRDGWEERIYTLSGILRCGYCGEMMRSQAGHGVRYYRDKSRLQHTRACPQTYVRADEVEAEVGRLIQSIQLPPGWREGIVPFLRPELGPERVKQEQQKARQRLERAKRLYLEGDLTETEYIREKAHCKKRLADLRPANYSDIMTVGEILESSNDWQRLEQKKTVATIVDDRSHSREEARGPAT